MDGGFQGTLLASVSLVHGEIDSNGLKLLEDGKSTVAALQAMGA